MLVSSEPLMSHSSNITDYRSTLIINHHNKYNNNEKFWNIMKITKMWHRDTKWENTVGKMAPTDLPYALLPQSFTLWETQYLWRTIKCGMLVLMWHCSHYKWQIFDNIFFTLAK